MCISAVDNAARLFAASAARRALRLRDAPTQPPLVILSKLVAGKAPWQTARYACRSPAAPAAPLPKKFFDTFWEPYFKPARTEGSLKIKIILVIPTEQSE